MKNSTAASHSEVITPANNDYLLLLSTQHEMIRLELEQILYFATEGNYTRIFLKSQKNSSNTIGEGGGGGGVLPCKSESYKDIRGYQSPCLHPFCKGRKTADGSDK